MNKNRGSLKAAHNYSYTYSPWYDMPTTITA